MIAPWYEGDLVNYFSNGSSKIVEKLDILDDKLRAYYQNVKFTQKLTISVKCKSPLIWLISHTHIIKSIFNENRTEAFIEL